MKRLVHSGLRFVVFAVVSASLLSLWIPKAGAETPRERKFEFDYTATVKDIPAGSRRVDLWIPVPHDGPFQKISDLQIESTYPYQFHEAQYGNKVLHIALKNPQQTTLSVEMRFNTLRKEHIQERLQVAGYSAAKEERDPNMSRWLQPDRLVPIDGKVKQWAEEVVNAAGAKTDLEKARAIYNHVVATVKYDKTGQGWGRGDIYYACDARRGNCTDFHAIVIGYCRALGIPARFAIGFPLPSDRGAGQISGYHCWAEFYAKGIGWVPLDASEAAKNPSKREYFFGAHDENRVEFSIGRDLTLNPKQSAEPLNYFVYPYAEVDGKPFTSVDKSFAYRDVPAATVASSDGSEAAIEMKHDHSKSTSTSKDLIEPAELASLLKSEHKPLVLQIGVVHLYKLAHIPGSIFAGTASEAEGIASLKKEVAAVPRDREIVCYCGCCPWDQCPNTRPAFNALHEMGFTKVRLLHLPNNFTQDWVMKNYPVEKGS
jgi:transglutaminase-like putative cysteine protease